MLIMPPFFTFHDTRSTELHAGFYRFTLCCLLSGMKFGLARTLSSSAFRTFDLACLSPVFCF